MSDKTVKAIAPILVALALASVALSLEGLTNSGLRGEIVAPVWATEAGPLEKSVGECVSFKAKVKNTGSVNATYIIVAKWKEHGTEEWETVGIEDGITLSPGQYSEVFILGHVECTEAMNGKYFDAKFILYDAETETLLDEKYIPEAWLVRSVLVQGLIAGYWLE